MSKVPVRKREFQAFNKMTAIVGTNCPQGGDSGHGGRTLLRIENNASTVWRVHIYDQQGEITTVEFPQAIEIILGGDSEASLFQEILAFATATLDEQLNENAEAIEMNVDLK